VKIKISKKPRIFTIKDIQIKDYGKIKLDTNEMISFITESGKEYDFAAKDWGVLYDAIHQWAPQKRRL
jgi:hypothetical protein